MRTILYNIINTWLLTTVLLTLVFFLAILYLRQSRDPPLKSATMISEKVYNLCRSGKSISAELAKDPTLAPGEVSKKLFDSDTLDHEKMVKDVSFKEPKAGSGNLQRAFDCGKWGNTRPSDFS
jgi:hypothetical protein